MSMSDRELKGRYWNSTHRQDDGSIRVNMIGEDGTEVFFFFLDDDETRTAANSLLRMVNPDGTARQSESILLGEREYQRGRADGMVQIMDVMRGAQ